MKNMNNMNNMNSMMMPANMMQSMASMQNMQTMQSPMMPVCMPMAAWNDLDSEHLLDCPTYMGPKVDPAAVCGGFRKDS